MMYTETANLMQASCISGGFTEIQNGNLSQEIMSICIVLNLKIVQVSFIFCITILWL
jgi:UDP-N-acetylglucosamine enolpyruvyl transferase